MINTWQYSNRNNSNCKVIEEQTLWGEMFFRVWLPDSDTVVCVQASDLLPLDSNRLSLTSNYIAYTTAAAKVAEVLDGSTRLGDQLILLSPMESNVIPLPHQVHALSRAISGDRVRYLLADEVGLGKTIEAGLIMRELKLRGLARRILIVTPKGLANQWVAEMQTHFNEHFQLVMGDDISMLQRMAAVDHKNSAWSNFNQVIVSLDSVKPIDKRRGWSAEKLAEYNRSRFEELITADWDMVIVDEAHRLGGSTDQVARYKLGQGLAEAAPYVLLLSATPHQGKTDAFHRLMTLLDNDAFPDMETVTRERVAPYVIRTEKRKAIDVEGKPLFKPRQTQMAPVKWESRHYLQELLYDAVTNYVCKGYNQAMKDKNRHIGFLMVLMQRLVVSSTRAIRTTLERRLESLKNGEMLVNQRLAELENSLDASDNFDEFYDMDGQEQLDELLKFQISALISESSDVVALLDAARTCEQTSPDAKAEFLIDWIYRLQGEKNEPDLKVLIFTEFVATQEMLKEFLEARGISVVTLNGSMDMDEREWVQQAFREKARVLVSTDAGGEGLNLQFCHVVINYDIPWNPMRLEQRIGRVDRIGQDDIVQAINFVFEDSIEFRVREVLEEKLEIIFKEFGIDKTGDVLDSAQAGELFDDIFTSAILDPDSIEINVNRTIATIRDEIQQVRKSSTIYAISDEPDLKAAERLRTHPLPHWVERMTVNYINSHGGSAIQKRTLWDLTWPDGEKQFKCVFNSREAERQSKAILLNLENKRIRGLALNLPQIAAGQPIPNVIMSNLLPGITGLWGLFEISILAGMKKKDLYLRIPMIRRGYTSVFISDEGKLFLPTARHIWDAIQTTDLKILNTMEYDESLAVYQKLMNAAEQTGQDIFNVLKQEHVDAIAREEERGIVAFGSRRNAIDRVGLPEVKQHRLAKCESEEKEWREELVSAKQIVPEIRPLVMFHISRGEEI